MGGSLRESILRAVLARAGGRTRSGAAREAEGGEELPQQGVRELGGGMISLLKQKRLCRLRW